MRLKIKQFQLLHSILGGLSSFRHPSKERATKRQIWGGNRASRKYTHTHRHDTRTYKHMKHVPVPRHGRWSVNVHTRTDEKTPANKTFNFNSGIKKRENWKLKVQISSKEGDNKRLGAALCDSPKVCGYTISRKIHFEDKWRVCSSTKAFELLWSS